MKNFGMDWCVWATTRLNMTLSESDNDRSVYDRCALYKRPKHFSATQKLKFTTKGLRYNAAILLFRLSRKEKSCKRKEKLKRT